jgi:hypothetical protein
MAPQVQVELLGQLALLVLLDLKESKEILDQLVLKE